MRSFYIMFTGCARRQLDCERIKNYLLANALDWLAEPAGADLIFVSTCGLSKFFEDNSIDKIQEATRYNAEVIVYGCLPAMNLERIREVFQGRTVKTVELEKLDTLFPDFRIKFHEVADANKAYVPPIVPAVQTYKQKIKKNDLYKPLKLLNTISALKDRAAILAAENTPFFSRKDISVGNSRFLIDSNNEHFTIRIAEGCLGKCSYCTIRKAIGRLKSKPVSQIRQEVQKGISGKQFRLNLVSSDTGSYGLDNGSNLPHLLKTVLDEDQRVSIGFVQDLHPNWICRYKDQLVELVATGRIKSILTAVQSGSPRVLQLMNRHTDLTDFKDTIGRMRKAFPGLRLRTQVIVGFPSETDTDLQDTIDFLTVCRFNEVDIFYYHETKVMASSEIQPKVSERVMDERVIELCKRLPITVSRHVSKSIQR